MDCACLLRQPARADLGPAKSGTSHHRRRPDLLPVISTKSM
ncbi:hypothetical protein D554_3590 [Bordetella holmesii 30539]|uniref:N-acetyltransferase YedL n=1 Tax=Bordetella holmesii 1058 TaxID=1247648 RepID=A0ABN0RYI3_9BORD|nr:hypothetical protein D560_3698 [Bordetella holmesii ATCC 51541]AIT28313.1 hypothetical protein D558_3673 [Bordetella holmesii 44057]EWM41104.1 hypothetical protein D555_3749 [Bordetella holmesii 35009]EWM43853.1 hypothetical protein D556_3676 [Bordetella holmesii 41130]EWM44992.1 hypothetical protein D557_2981 [Bordetella holmesii 70147]EXF88313.1 hypothetical protein D554_3590 [Bordetella holmesii 30539]EXX94314.1 hypothetical protein D559_1723 [Bordetella holmesii 1058]